MRHGDEFPSWGQKGQLNKMATTTYFHDEKWVLTALGTPVALYASRPLESLKGSAPILLMGGIHGDEPEGVELAEKTLAWLLEDAKKPQREVQNEWVVIPCLNVDGFRKNERTNGRGVDLNRNYPSQSWSAAFEKPRYNPGPSAGSEPEIQGVVHLLKALSPKLVIHCHSWNPCVVASGERAIKDAQRLALSSGYEVVPEIGYPTPGSLSQFGWHDHQIPVICIEEQEGAPLETVWPHFGAGMKQIFLDPSAR